MVICITISVNYNNLLDIILPQNYNFFNKWYIVTEENDYKTIEVIQKYSFKNVEILYFDFKQNTMLNKGEGINYALNMIDENETVLLLDSDIFITDYFKKYINIDFKHGTLYTFTRYDYYNYNNFKNDKHDNIYKLNFTGFFQLFKHKKKYKYENCKECDFMFSLLFPNKVLLEGKVIKHLGMDNDNFIMN
jgi:hypothetical protein